MRAIDLVLGIGWLAFWIGWLAAAVRAKPGRQDLRRSVPIRLVILAVAVALSKAGAFRGHAIHDLWLGILGLTMFVLGLALAIWARVHLGRNWGMPMSQRAEPELVTTGPYRLIRNPIYSGLIFADFGTAIATSTGFLAIAVLVSAFFVYSAVMEQRFMQSRFPEQYADYKRSTKLLVPYLF
jgi:protein-S-isoprenylcysteine O-methyltransferase Ste14